MKDDQKGFLAALVVFVLLIIILPVIFLIGTFLVSENSRPSVGQITSLEGKPTATALAELNELEFGCKEDTEQSELASWTCWADEATIAGPCHWSVKISEKVAGTISHVEILKADGQCKR
jgi:hypothetical protein